MNVCWIQRSLLGVLAFALTLSPSVFAEAAKKMPSPTLCKGKKWSQSRFSHRLLGGLLKAYVKNGKVHYNGLKAKRKKLDRYLCRLARTKPSKIRGRKGRFAFWINAYNAITLRAVLDIMPTSRAAQRRFSVAKKSRKFWDGRSYEVGGRFYTLNAIEHKLLRPRFKDPRLHFAIVCASIGCPALASYAYSASKLGKQLNRGTRLYLRSKRGMILDRKSKTLKLSKIFKWFKKDFSYKRYKGVLSFVTRFAPKADAAFLRANAKSIKIEYLPYSWKLNVK